MPHSHDLKVRFHELDPYGHLNHSIFLQYFETGRVELLEKVGLGLDELTLRGYQLVVAHIEIVYLKSVQAGDVVTVETEVLQLRPASSMWRQRMLRENRVVAHQKLRVVVTDLLGKPVRTPTDLVQKLVPYCV